MSDVGSNAQNWASRLTVGHTMTSANVNQNYMVSSQPTAASKVHPGYSDLYLAPDA